MEYSPVRSAYDKVGQLRPGPGGLESRAVIHNQTQSTVFRRVRDLRGVRTRHDIYGRTIAQERAIAAELYSLDTLSGMPGNVSSQECGQ